MVSAKVGLIFIILHNNSSCIDFNLKYSFCANFHKSRGLNPFLAYCQLTCSTVTVGGDYVRGAGAA